MESLLTKNEIITKIKQIIVYLNKFEKKKKISEIITCILESIIEEIIEIPNILWEKIPAILKDLTEIFQYLETKGFFKEFGLYQDYISSIEKIFTLLIEIINYGGEFIFFDFETIQENLYETDDIITEINKEEKEFEDKVLMNLTNEFALTLWKILGYENFYEIKQIKTQFIYFYSEFNSKKYLIQDEIKEVLKKLDPSASGIISARNLNKFFQNDFFQLYKKWCSFKSKNEEIAVVTPKRILTKCKMIKLRLIETNYEDENISQGLEIIIGQNPQNIFGRRETTEKEDLAFKFHKNDKGISRSQFAIIRMPGNFVIKDLSVRNPTCLLIKNEYIPLSEGMVFMIGENFDEILYVEKIKFSFKGQENISFEKSSVFYEPPQELTHRRFIKKSKKKEELNGDYLILKGYVGTYENREKKLEIDSNEEEIIFSFGLDNSNIKFDNIDDNELQIVYRKNTGWLIGKNPKEQFKSKSFIFAKNYKQSFETFEESDCFILKEGMVIFADKNLFEVCEIFTKKHQGFNFNI